MISAEIASGISICRNYGSFQHDYHATIIYDFPVVILGFGIKGGSSYSMGASSNDDCLRSGDVFLYRPEDAKTKRFAPAQLDCQTAALKFDAHRIDAVLEEVLDLDGRSLPNSVLATRLATNVNVRRILQPLMDNPFASPLDRLTAESTALSVLATCLEYIPSKSLIEDCNLSMSERKSLSRAMDLLLSDLASPPDLYALASEAGMSHTRLNRCFKKAHGCTIFAWLRAYRLDVARKLLHQNKHSITEIAFLCGFSSASHFSAAFKTQYSCTPQDFRQLQIA